MIIIYQPLPVQFIGSDLYLNASNQGNGGWFKNLNAASQCSDFRKLVQQYWLFSYKTRRNVEKLQLYDWSLLFAL